MNIIKLKDIIKPNDELFNSYLKGKYAYWVHMRYIVPFDFMKHEGYVECELDIKQLLLKEDGTLPKPFGAPYIDVYKEDMFPYIDMYETDRANSVIKYALLNGYTPDSNITIEELKKFRTWLATNLLLFDVNNDGEPLYNENDIHVLKYYKGGMYDDVVKALSTFGGNNESNVTLEQLGQSTCGCSSDLSSLYNLSVNVCDSMTIYRKNIYTHMVEMFSKIDFWSQFPSPFILEFKKYIDNIIKCNFKLTKSQYISEYADCGCINNDEQADMIAILKRLSQSLQYIADNNTIGNKNYINDSLRDWSSRLYELMEW